MIGALPTPPINAGNIIDLYEISFGDSLRLISGTNPKNFINFPVNSRVSVRQHKVYSATNVNGRSGTIKEFTGTGDVGLEIRATFVAVEYDLTPISLLTKLSKLFSIFQAEGYVDVINRRLNDSLKVNKIFLTDIDLPEDTYHSMTVTIRALSDSDYMLDYFQRNQGSSGRL